MNPKLPDISIIFKLYLECGRWIGLESWFESFCNVLGCDSVSTQDQNLRFVYQIRMLGF